MIRAAIVGTGGIAGICHVPALRAAADRAVIVAGMDVDAKSAFTARPVRRGEIGAADPFYHSMNGDL